MKVNEELDHITFWNSYPSRPRKKTWIDGVTSENFKRNSIFSTPITVSLEQPTWTQWDFDQHLTKPEHCVLEQNFIKNSSFYKDFYQ